MPTRTERERLTKLPPPGTLSSQGYSAFSKNAELMGWKSLIDQSFRIFLDTNPRSLLRLPQFNERVLEELRRALQAFEKNKKKPIEEPKMLIGYGDINNPRIRVGQSFPQVFAPIPHRISNVIVSDYLRDLQADSIENLYLSLEMFPPTTQAWEKEESTIKENLEVMDVLFGFGKQLRSENGVYFLT